ncbi:hypothetical protein [uncultured Thiodictyon sp.]|uniref:hypothetical protein n=1 Tax=uncultured Thiodictyon sp. TaxID=1846217 RepID=UPI0025D5E84A|nr:hypothetical protein [uncultured Thiodictyon sp.]
MTPAPSTTRAAATVPVAPPLETPRFEGRRLRVFNLDARPWFNLYDLLDAMKARITFHRALADITARLGPWHLAHRPGIGWLVSAPAATLLTLRPQAGTCLRLYHFVQDAVFPVIGDTRGPPAPTPPPAVVALAPAPAAAGLLAVASDLRCVLPASCVLTDSAVLHSHSAPRAKRTLDGPPGRAAYARQMDRRRLPAIVVDAARPLSVTFDWLVPGAYTPQEQRGLYARLTPLCPGYRGVRGRREPPFTTDASYEPIYGFKSLGDAVGWADTLAQTAYAYLAPLREPW